MAKRDVDEFYKQVCNQYIEMLDNIKDFEDAVKSNMMSPEQYDQFKIMLEPLKQNYERISYIMFLLNAPNKKDKKTKYENMNKKLLSKLDVSNSTKNQISENSGVIENIKNYTLN